MIIQGRTDIGRVRAENQDTWRAGRRADKSGWAVVCDGMGGAAAGRLASVTAAEAMERQLQETDERETERPDEVLRQAVEHANDVVYRRALDGGRETMGMGTTIVALLVRDGHAVYAHVGDSRIYLCRGNTLVQLTRDHSLVQQMVEAGSITPEDARTHPQRNRITRALGVGARVEVDVGSIPLQAGDRLLLCSDGLSGPLTHGTLAGVLAGVPVFAQPRRLVELAREAGGPDNITAVVVAMTEEEADG